MFLFFDKNSRINDLSHQINHVGNIDINLVTVKHLQVANYGVSF